MQNNSIRYEKLNGLPLVFYVLAILVFIIYPLAAMSILKLFYVYVVAVFYLMLLFSDFFRRNQWAIVKDSRELFVLYALFFASYFWSVDPKETSFQLLGISIYPFLYMVFCFVVMRFEIKHILNIFLTIPVVFFILNVILLLTFGTIRPQTYAQGAVLHSYSNHMIALVEVALPFVFYSLVVDKKKMQFVILFLMILFNLVVSLSRGGVLIFALGLILIMLMFVEGLNKKARYGFLSVSFLLVFFAGAFQFEITREMIFGLLDRVTSTTVDLDMIFMANPNWEVAYELEGRNISYNIGVYLIKEHPWIGVGYGGYSYFMREYVGIPKISHNLIITIWTSVGIMGVALFVKLFYRAFDRLRSIRSRLSLIGNTDAYWYSANIVALIMVLAHGMFRPTMSNPILYLLLAVAIMGRDVSAEMDEVHDNET